MTKWMSGIRGACAVLGLWMIGWMLGFGGLIELFVDPDGEIMDIWPAVMAVPGVLGGLFFAALLVIVERGRRLDTVPVPRAAVWGALTGVLLGAAAVATGTHDGLENLSLTAAEAIGILTGLGIVAAVGTVIFFLLVARWPLRPAARRAH